MSKKTRAKIKDVAKRDPLQLIGSGQNWNEDYQSHKSHSAKKNKTPRNRKKKADSI